MSFKNFRRFFTTDIWRISLKKLPPGRSFLIKQIRILLLVIRGFLEDKCSLRASALTLYTLLSIVPLSALALAIAKGFGIEKMLEIQLLERFPGQQEVINRIIEYAHTLLKNTKGSIVGGTGIIFLFWIVIRVLGNIERSFNDIWGIKKQRSFARKFSDYLSIILITPIIIISASSLTIFIKTKLIYFMDKFKFIGFMKPFLFFLLNLLPYFMLWALFTFIYIFLPNTKVNFKSGLLAGIIAGSLYQLLQWGYINFQIGVSKYNAIYGSLSALPLFLIWLQMSWLIVLLGAEISFAYQNVEMYEYEPASLNISYSYKKLLSLNVASLIVKNFINEKKPLTASQISHRLEIPIRLVREIIYELIKAGIILEVKTEDEKEQAYQPACDVNKISIKYVIDSLEKTGIDDIPVASTKELEELKKSFQEFGKIIETSSANKLLKQI